MRLINFFDGAQSSTEPTIGNVVTSSLVKYANDAAFEAGEDGAPITGNIYYNTTTNTIRYYTSGAWSSLVDETKSQTLTNKGIDGNNNTVTNIDGDEVIVDAISGLTATDAQAAFAEHQVEIEQNTDDIADIQAALGITSGDTDMGTYTGSTLSDNADQVTINQELETAVESKLDASEKGQPNGVAELDGSGQIPSSQLPTSMMEYYGDWSAATNTPTLANTDTGELGTVYRVTAPGTVDFGAGNISFDVGDWVYNNGSVWGLSVETTLPDTDALPEGSSNLYYTEGRVAANASVVANTAKVSASGSIDTHSDVDTSTTPPLQGQALTWDSVGSKWKPGAGGGGGSGKNYVESNDFENNSTTGWSLGTTGTLTNGMPTGTPTFGSGASGDLSIAATATDPLAGSYSLEFDSSAATTAGNMLSTDVLTIDREDMAKVLTWKFYYEASVNPANADWSGTSTNSLAVAVWDVTNSVWLSNTGNFSLTQSSGVGIASGSFQTNSDTAQIRFVVYNANATSGAITVLFDDFSVGPQTTNIGTPMAYMGPLTTTGTWVSGTTTYAGNYWREGEFLVGSVKITQTGAPTSASLDINLPSGLSMDTTKLQSTSNGSIIPASGGTIIDSGTANFDAVAVYVSSATSFRVSVLVASGSFTTQSSVTQAVPMTWANGDSLTLYYRVPIVGWSSNVQMSNDTDTRVVSFIALGQSPSGIINASFNVAKFTSINKDTHGAYNSSTGFYTVPVSGFYSFSAQLDVSATFAVAQYVGMRVGNSTTGQYQYNYHRSPVAVTNSYPFSLSGTVYANAGDIIQMDVVSNATTPTYSTALSGTALSIERLSGPSVIAATETVNCRYINTAGTSISNSGDIALTFPTKTYDSHNAFSSDTFTVPVSGKYLVNCTSFFASSTYASGNRLYMYVAKNGTSYSLGAQQNVQAAITTNFGASVSATVDCLAGDTLKVFVGNNRTAGATSLGTGAHQNYIDITRTGN